MAGIEHVVSMEEVHTRKVVRREAGETSSGTTEETQKQSISIQTTTLEEKFKTVKEAVENALNESSSTTKIQKVVFSLQNSKDYPKYYEPRLLSFGPIHHGKDGYDQGEKYKLVLTCKFMEDSGKSMEDVYNKIKEKIKELRECFSDEVTEKYDDESLAWLLFVDGCAILQYIYCSTNDKFEDSYIEDDRLSFAQQDLFLLENQLPYWLLTLLMSLSKKKNDFKTSIETFIKGKVIVGKRQQHPNTSVHQKHIHLLDFLRTSLLDSRRSKVAKPEKKQNWKFNFSVQELRAAGIFVQRSKNKNSSLSDISFTAPFGCLGYLSNRNAQQRRTSRIKL